MSAEKKFNFAPGDAVIVLNPDKFLVALAKRIAGRPAHVVRTYQVQGWYARPRVVVRFGLKGGRGKEFEETFDERDLSHAVIGESNAPVQGKS